VITPASSTTNGPAPIGGPGGVSVLVIGRPERIAPYAGALGGHGCVVEMLDDPARAMERYDGRRPDAVVLDVAPQQRTAALEALDRLRRVAQARVVVVTDRDDVDARLQAISVRAQDCVAPVAPSEVVARVAVLVRRHRGEESEAARYGDLVVDRAGRRVVRRGRTAVLTQRQQQVLDVLLEQPGRVVTKDELLDRVWSNGRRSANAVEAQISALRRKLHTAGPPVIHTAHGEGYVFRPAVNEPRPSGDLVSERERRVSEREEAATRRAKLLRELEHERD
jgi:DNA-binding response OmpR family regulator